MDRGGEHKEADEEKPDASGCYFIYHVGMIISLPLHESDARPSYHVWKLDVGQAVDERLAEVGQLVQQRIVLLLDHLVLLLDGLQVGLHGGDLAHNGRPKRHERIGTGEANPTKN